MNRTVAGFAGSVKGAAAALGVALSFGKIISETSEAQDALAQLSIAFRNSAEAAKRSQQDILDFSDAAQRSTTFSDEAITRAQTSLLRFGRVSGETFGRARKDIADVAAALGTDLESAAFTVGRALESPTQGLRQLRSLGVIFTASQQKLIKSLEETGQVAKAQEIILTALEDRFSGAAEAARNTLGGAITGLKNALGDLFESTDQGARGAADGINEISRVISDPRFKASVQAFVGESLEWLAAFANLVGKSIEGWRFLIGFVVKDTPSAVDKLLARQSELGASLDRALEAKAKTLSSVERANAQRIIDRARAELVSIQRQIESFRQGQGGPQGIGSRQASRPGGVSFVSDAEVQRQKDDALAAARAEIDEVRIKAQKRNIEGLSKVLQDFNEQTRTSLEAANSEFEATRLKVQELFETGRISAIQFADRMKDATIRFNEAISIEPVRVSVQKVVETLSQQQRGVQSFVDTVKTGLTNLAQSGEFTGRAILKYLLSAFTAKVLYNAIDNLGAHLSKALNGASGKGGAAGSIGSFIGGLFGGFAAGGGQSSRPRIVGEEGPELLLGGGTIMNSRQLAFAAGNRGGAQINMGDTHIVVQGNADQRVLAMMEVRLAEEQKKSARMYKEMLERNGIAKKVR